MEQQQENIEKAMKRLADQHREKVALLEKQFLQQKQQLLRGKIYTTKYLVHKSPSSVLAGS